MKLNGQLLELIRHCNCIDGMILSEEPGNFQIHDGTIFLKREYHVGQWLHIQGSILNDGLYRVDNAENGLHKLSNGTDDETPTQSNEAFTGTVRGLIVSPAFVALAVEIMAFDTKNAPTGKTSEKFGSYSYTRATNANGVAVGWSEAFAVRLRPYKQMFAKIRV